jgi:hypothetical protein
MRGLSFAVVTGLAAGPVAGVASGPALADDIVFFRSPSGNIHCLIATGDFAAARCDLREATLSYPVPPADCDLEWGLSFEVGPTGRGTPACVGDTVQSPTSIVLGYGDSLSLGGLTCRSERSGMTCTNAAGHGFAVAKASQRVF